MANKDTITVERMTTLPDNLIRQFNLLRDPGTEWDETEGKKFLDNDDNALYLAFLIRQVVGFLTAYKLQRLDKKKVEILIYEVAVHPDFRKQGVGKALLQKVKDWTKEMSAEEAWVLTNQSNTAAMALYQSMGGKIESTDEQMFTFYAFK